MAASAAMSARIPTAIFRIEAPTQPPLSARERSALIRILGLSADETQKLEARRKAALDAYLETLSSPPLVPDEVLGAARALIRIWAEVGVASRPQPVRAPTSRPKERRSEAIFATLLELDPQITACTETLSPHAMTDVFERYGYL